MFIIANNISQHYERRLIAHCVTITILITSVSSPSSSAQCSPLLAIGLSNFLPFCSIFGYSLPAPSSRPEQIVTPTSPRASYITFTETRSPLQNSFTPVVVGSMAGILITSLTSLHLLLEFKTNINVIRYVNNFIHTDYHLQIF
jgi:hypothetical protein